MRQEAPAPKPQFQPINPNEVNGLAPEQQQMAVELRQNILARENRPTLEPGSTHAGMLSGNSVSGPSVASLWSSDISKGIRDLQVSSATRAAKRHYKKHEGAYQEQALMEATDAGKEINFGPTDINELKGPEPQLSNKRRLGNAALAAVDGLVTEQLINGVIAPGGSVGNTAIRDTVSGYLAYRFGKGAVVRGKAALAGRGDPEKALATPVSMVHQNKKDLIAERARRIRYEARDAKHA
jgi:hypothetical protein